MNAPVSRFSETFPPDSRALTEPAQPGTSASITDAVEQLALALGRAGAVPVPELVRALERAAERLRVGSDPVGGEPPHDLITQAEAARAIGVSRQAIHQWIRRGGVRAYRAPSDGRRQTQLVSLAEVRIAASRTADAPFSVSLRRQLLEFIDLIEPVVTPALADQLRAGVESPAPSARRVDDSSRVLREFVIAAMGTSSMQQEFTQAGVQMLAELPPEVLVAPGTAVSRLLDQLGLVVHASGGSGFDSAATAVLGLLGCATVGVVLDGPDAAVGRGIAEAASSVWGDDWLERLFDVAFHLEESAPSALIRYTSSLTYLATNRFFRQAQGAGVTITYARSPGPLLPRSYYGMPVLTDILAGRRATPSWWFTPEPGNYRPAALTRTDGNPFRIFSFERGLLDPSIHGIRRYCFSAEDARKATRAQLSELSGVERERYLACARQTLTHTLAQPFVEVVAIDRERDFDWWKDHIIRSSPREIILGLRNARARKVAHALLVQEAMLPQVVDAAETDGALRDRLRIYVKNLEFGIVDERYRDDVKRGVSRVVKAATESLSPAECESRAEAEIARLLR